MVREIKQFVRVFNTPYRYTKAEKLRWSEAGKNLIKAIAKQLNASCMALHYNPSGIVDRGYITAFLNRNGKYVYIVVSDSNIWKYSPRVGPILYRRAESPDDYVGGQNRFASPDREGILRMVEEIDLLLS
ncbi:MAG: hypothetical protein QW334_03045 [Thermofilum sp.]